MDVAEVGVDEDQAGIVDFVFYGVAVTVEGDDFS